MPEAAWIQGKDNLETRNPVIEALKKGDKCCAIVMRQIITAGINVRIHNLINASGGYAAHNLIQQVGRGLRNADDKDILEYYDFLFTNNPYLWRHSEWRMEVLKSEGHTVTLKEEYDF
jgi:superfamily II DNA or RNA helicase